ncbi:hypothetical protein BP6252_12151 [Coleophoma cylindrospora]|uniref:Only prolin and serin are matching in the corresponding protein n=1 Tax=Coleophoma cylindrospora TaxID=1849047 RepID=A0A3D8QGF2_9HELO|nr:hypothetical protein BP6252_12151 [Coleophoma cylindrospora]
MSPRLKPLLLPQLVERRKRESMSELELDLCSSCYTQNSTSSEGPSPVTPTFSSRGHFRYPSSTSSLESPVQPTVLDCPASPTFTAPKSKRSLPDVQEEPQEKDCELDMFDEDMDALYDCLCDDMQCLHRDPSMVQSSVQLPTRQDFDDYDLADGFFSDGEYALSTRQKKRRAPDSPLAGLATRIGTRFPSFSRKWRLKKSPSLLSMNSDRDLTLSRGASSRSSSVSNSGRQVLDNVYESHMPPTPAKSVFGSREEILAIPIDIEKANLDNSDREEGFATTPLLPPLVMEAAANKTQVMYSPLQSPSVADPQDSKSGTLTPIDNILASQLACIPSPPLSTKQSVSSFQRSTFNRPSHLIPSSEIPPIVIADANDEWSIKLGHANFTIQPEPYLPENFDLEACRQLRANWDLARCNYTRHLVRTGEHYGVTSKTYKLTEEKWAATDSVWRKNNDLTIGNTVSNSSEAFATLKHTTLGDPGSNNIMTKIPSLNDPRSGGKFPQLGDEDIVGPMVQAAAQLQQSPGKKAKLFRFFAEKFPVGLGRS